MIASLLKKLDTIWLLAVVVLGVIVVLTLLHHPVPQYLWVIFSALAGGHVALAQPSTSSGPTLPNEAEVIAFFKSAGKAIPGLLHDLEDVFGASPAMVPPVTAVPPPPAATVTSIVRPTEPPTAS